jgi:uncharacterized iron-regulated membrane protein
MNNAKSDKVSVLRTFRKVHRTMGALLFILFFVVAITGFLLGWKKNSNGWILPATAQGTSSNFDTWKPIKELHKIADSVLIHSIDSSLSTEIDRIDIRKEKGIVKFIYKNHYWEIQLDGSTGKALQTNLRKSDFIEDIHDASFLDFYFKTKGEPIKLIYTLIMSVSLFMFCATGFWLWYGPKLIRMRKRNSKMEN